MAEAEEAIAPPAGELEAAAPAPDVTLATLYKSARPPVELVPGVSLSPVINAAWLPKEAKVRERAYSTLEHSVGAGCIIPLCLHRRAP